RYAAPPHLSIEARGAARAPLRGKSPPFLELGAVVGYSIGPISLEDQAPARLRPCVGPFGGMRDRKAIEGRPLARRRRSREREVAAGAPAGGVGSDRSRS